MDENQLNAEALQVEEAEKQLPVSQVNKIVQREKEQAAIRAKREAEEMYERKLEEIKSHQAQNNADHSRNLDLEQVYQQVTERFNAENQQRQLEEQLNNVAKSYMTKMEQGRAAYGEDFEKAMADFDPTAFPQLVFLVAGMDNAADVMFEIAKNPTKLATFDRLAEKSPRQAQTELAKLAASIAANKQALVEAEGQETNAPLDRLQPTRVSTSSGKANIRDLRSQPWLKG